MCPYARFQGVMFDRDTLTITYDTRRGEPRGSRSKKADPAAMGLGDCIDCTLCVQVCPTGIDIRDGLQYECIGCAACIDACDQVMDKMNYPRGLIRYTSENAMAQGLQEKDVFKRVTRPRVLVYTGILLAVTLALFAHLLTRSPIKLDVIPDRSLGREVADGMIENTYRLQLMNSSETARRFVVSVEGIESIFVEGRTEFEVGPAGVRMVPVTVRTKPGNGKPGSNPIRFGARDSADESVSTTAKSTFFVPR
jgi:cytochrome c oxidase accessory protein FixG